MKSINVLQFICPAGLYGAEMWILALAKYLRFDEINCQLAVTHETENQNLEVYNRFRTLGLDAHKIEIRGRFDPCAILKLCRIINKLHIDIIHTHGYKSDIIGLIAARITGIKALATPHGFENVKDFKLQTFIRLGCLSLKYFNRVAPLSEELKSDMHRIKVDDKKVHLIRNGVDLKEVGSVIQNKNSKSMRDEKKIGYVGQMAHRKNVGDLLKTFDLLYKDKKNIRLILIGDGPMRKELEKQALTLPSHSKIKFLGYRADRLSIVRDLDIFCMTSSLEGIPRCMMEAMALEVPVAAYDIPGVDKLILPNETGLLAPFGNIDRLKTCWEEILFNDSVANDLASNGRKHIVENFSAQRMAAEYTLLYKEMVNRHK